MNHFFLPERPRRLRRTGSIRSALAEVSLRPSQFVLPVFLTDQKGAKEPISSMPGQCRYSLESMEPVLREAVDLGLGGIAIFPKISDEKKNSSATEALSPDGLVPAAIRRIKKEFPSLTVFSDIALDPFSSDGHDGLVSRGGGGPAVALPTQRRAHSASSESRHHHR